MIFRQSDNSYFLVTPMEKDHTYPFELIPTNDKDFPSSLAGTFAISFFQKLEILEDMHKKISKIAPEIYGKVAYFYAHENISPENLKNTRFFHGLYRQMEKTNQHRQILFSHLLTSENYKLREMGAKLLEHLPVNAISDIINYCKKIYNKFPRRAVGAVKEYLHNLEQNENEFDKLLFYHKRQLKYIYSTLHIKPSDRAQMILFKNTPPKGSLAEAVKIFRTQQNSELICSLIDKFDVSNEDALNTIQYLSFTIAEKIVYKMSVQELIKCYPILKRSGVVKNEAIFFYIAERLKDIPRKKSAAAKRRIVKYIPKHAYHIQMQTDKCITPFKEKNYGITKRITLLIDVSGSMYNYQDIGKTFISIFRSLVKENGEISVWLFAKDAWKLPNDDENLVDTYDRHFIGTPGSIPAKALINMADLDEKTDVVILISDGNENGLPLFADGYKYYARKTKRLPAIVFIKTGYSSGRFEANLSGSSLSVFVIEFSDYESAMEELQTFIFSDTFSKLIEEINS